MKIPRTISVAGHTIKIRYTKDLKIDNKEVWGLWDDDKHTIILRRGMDKTRKQEILLHEVLHAIDHIHVLGLSEKAVKILGVELLGLIKNNHIQFLEPKK